MQFSKLQSAVLTIGFLNALVLADFAVFNDMQDTQYCKTNGGGCLPITSELSPIGAPTSLTGESCPSDSNSAVATAKDGSGLTSVANSEGEVWWANGLCGSPAPYYCFILNGEWTCNDDYGGNVMNCVNTTAISSACHSGIETTDNYESVFSCSGPITC